MSSHHYNLSLLWIEVLAENGERPALHYSVRTITYTELGCMVDRIADTLINLGLRRGDVVAIVHTKKPLSYALMLALLRLGLPYVSIDVDSPHNRNRRILETSGPSLLCFDDAQHSGEMKALAETVKCRSLLLDESALSPSVPQDLLARQHDMAHEVDGSCIAYIMFTSGSTGTPKGVAVTHENVLHFIEWALKRFRITTSDNFANLSPMYFDNSVFDFYSGLFSGAALTPINKDILASPYDLVPYVAEMGCTIWFSVPSLLMYLMTMKALSALSLPDIRCIVFGGEGYPKPELRKLYDFFISRAQLVNVYGPTECTCICSAHTISQADLEDPNGLPPLGRLNQNFDYRILDDEDSDAAEGELCLIGPNVATGYFNDPERTNQSFFTLAEPRRFMKRMYRTGDLVREEQGVLWFVGRKDNQIKHMGYRIELEEIEHGLVQIAEVDQAAVVYQRTHSTHGKIMAFVACAEGIAEAAILELARKALPDYMVPSSVVILSELPKNQNGKVDRVRLRASLDCKESE
jgi:D-alanine--poly(phosphoribitol) ligase subunit 1